MYKSLLASAAILALFSGCNDSIDQETASSFPGGFVVMDSATGDIPYPNDILFAPNATSTNDAGDGTLNIPYEPDDSDAVVKMALNTLDGFSTSSPITVSITDDMDNTTLAGNVRVFKAVAQATALTNYVPAVGLVTGELSYPDEFILNASEGKLAIIPTKPLEPNTTYVVVITNGVKNAKGQSLTADAVTSMINGTTPLCDLSTQTPLVYLDAATACGAEGLRQLNQARLAALMGQDGMECSLVPSGDSMGVSCPDVVMSWNFTTQSIGTVVTALAETDAAGAISVQSTGLDTTVVGPYGSADIYAGVLGGLPYYLGTPDATNPTAPLMQPFSDTNGSAIVSTLPQLQSTKNVPLLMTLPNANSGMSMPANGWPVVIFQHGITQHRGNVLAVADALAQAGYAAVSIDLPLHGISASDPLFGSLYMEGMERTFDVDFDQDGSVDASGQWYLNLANLLVARDNVRQSTSDLVTLYNSLSNVTGATLDASRVAFLGHSMGAIAAFGFFDANKTLEGATLAMPGGGIVQFLSNSASFGEEIRAGLAQVGIEADSAEYNAFLLAAQTILDDADPINYAAKVADKHTYFALEAIGDGSEGSGDQTIPNNVLTAPLSGTDPLLYYMGFADINASAPGMVPVTGNTVSRFVVGGHSSLLLPDIATAEMQRQTAAFIGSRAQAIVIGDNTLLQQ